MSGSIDISSNKSQVGTGRDLSIVLLRFAFILVLNTYYLILPAQISATFKGDSSHIEIGDYLNMKLVVNAQPEHVIDFPAFPGDSIGK
jgi:hypothetical protein